MFNTHLFRQTSTVLSCLLSVFLLSQPTPVQAGCGCTKAPPAPASVRPHATYPGTEVAIFDASLQVGQVYDVTFTSHAGASVTVQAQALSRRDLADGVYKPQLNMALPDLPLGPAQLQVSAVGQDAILLSVDDSALTVVPQPLVLATEVGETFMPDFQAAVGRDGTVYVSLDLTGTTLPRTFQVQALGYPLLFTNDEVVVYNVQGFVMQLLEEGMPGLYTISAANAGDSNVLQYSRHEFNTYFLQHDERLPHAVDASDTAWHADGTPHINHDHLVVAIAGMLSNGSLPLPGATPAFTLHLETFSFFHHGLFGDASIEMTGNTVVDGYNSNAAPGLHQGDILSNGVISISDTAVVTGDVLISDAPTAFIPVDMPSGLEDLGAIQLSDGTITIGMGSYQASALQISHKGTLSIDNSAGPVTLYLTGPVQVSGKGKIVVADPDPEKFALYVASSEDVRLSGFGNFYGVVYAPESLVKVSGNGQFFGSFVGGSIEASGSAALHYDTALRGQAVGLGSEPSSTDTAETTTTAVIEDSFTSTDTTPSPETTTQSSSPGKGKGKKKK